MLITDRWRIRWRSSALRRWRWSWKLRRWRLWRRQLRQSVWTRRPIVLVVNLPDLIPRPFPPTLSIWSLQYRKQGESAVSAGSSINDFHISFCTNFSHSIICLLTIIPVFFPSFLSCSTRLRSICHTFGWLPLTYTDEANAWRLSITIP